MTLLLESPISAASTMYSHQGVASAGSVAEEFYVLGARPDFDRRLEIQLVGAETNPRGAWLARYLEEQLNALLRLRSGWDGYRARPLAEVPVDVAVRLLFGIADEWTLPPQVFPLVDGGVQFEWHAAGHDVEIEVDGTGLAHLLETDPEGNVLVDSVISWADPTTLSYAHAAVRHVSERITAGLSARV